MTIKQMRLLLLLIMCSCRQLVCFSLGYWSSNSSSVFDSIFLTTTLSYCCSWAVLFWAKLKTPKTIAVKILKWMIVCKKKKLVKDATGVSCRVSPSRTEWLHIDTAWLPPTRVSKWPPPKSYFWPLSTRNFLRIASTLEAETSMSEKAECLLGTAEDKKISFLEWPSLLTSEAQVIVVSLRYYWILLLSCVLTMYLSKTKELTKLATFIYT